MEIWVHKSALMHHLLHAVATHGYIRHAAGSVTPKGVDAMLANMIRLYGIGHSPDKRWREKRAGRAGARLFLHPDYQEPVFRWWLLLSAGEHPALEREKVVDHGERRHRLTVFEQFEAVRQPAPGGAPRWTWRITAEYYAMQQERIRTAIRLPDDRHQLEQVLKSIHRFPGFRGVRNQVNELRRFTVAEWERSKRSSSGKPPLPNRVQGYVKPRVFPTVPLGEVRDRLLDGKPPFTVDQRQADTTKRAPAP